MSEKVLRVDVESNIVIFHRSAVVILIVTAKRAVDVVVCIFRVQMDCLVEISLAFLVFFSCKTECSANAPRISVVRIQFERFAEVFFGLDGIFLLQGKLRLEREGLRIFWPPSDDDIES